MSDISEKTYQVAKKCLGGKRAHYKRIPGYTDRAGKMHIESRWHVYLNGELVAMDAKNAPYCKESGGYYSKDAAIRAAKAIKEHCADLVRRYENDQ